MTYLNKKILFLFLILIQTLLTQVYGQKKASIIPIWDVRSICFLDNREYFNPYTNDQTMFGNRLDISGGYQIDTIHSFQTGLSFLYEFGSELSDIKIFPTLYYQQKSKYTTFFMGAFPRAGRLDYPNLLLLDTLNYYRPNIEGSFIAINGKTAFQNIWIDWTGRQSPTRNESFLAGTSGKIQYKHLFLENYLYMYHHAGTSVSDTSFHLRDNGGGVFRFGLDYRRQLFTTLSAGIAFSYDRHRPEDYQIKSGFYGKIESKYKQYLIRLIHYQGQSLSLAYGDSFYRAKRYTRIDTEFKLINHPKIQLKLQISGHLFDREINFSQKLMLIIK